MIGQNTAVYLNDGSGCEKCNFTGRFGGWINGRWHGYPLIKCRHCEPTPTTIDAIEDELARSAVEKISDRPAKESRFKGRAV